MFKLIGKIILVVLLVFSVLVILQLGIIWVCAKKLEYSLKPFEKSNAYATNKVLFAGDSTAVGTGATNNLMSTSGWYSQDFPDASIENHSRNGMRLAGLVDVLKDLQGKQFDLAILQIGANDILHFTPLKTIKAQQLEVLRLTKNIAHRVVILHCGDMGEAPLFIWPFKWIYTQRTLAVREIYKNHQDSHVSYVDIYAFNKSIRNMKSYYAVDQLHLNDRGYQLWYSYIKQTVNQ